jgi:hypothetical protein
MELWIPVGMASHRLAFSIYSVSEKKVPCSGTWYHGCYGGDGTKQDHFFPLSVSMYGFDGKNEVRQHQQQQTKKEDKIFRTAREKQIDKKTRTNKSK